MATQQYSLRWNNYLRHITYAFENLRNQDDFVDVTLFCEGKKIKAHKVLLSACSGYFKEIFKESPHPHPVIIFKFIKYDDLAAIIEFMYQGEVNVQQEALQSFLQTAELLAVQGLTSEEKEKEVPKPKSKIITDQLIKNIPITSTLRSVTSEPVEQTQTQNATIEFTTDQLVASTPATVQIASANINVKKRKISFNPDTDAVYTTETVEFTTKDDPTVKTAELQYLPSTVKMDLPEYIDCNQMESSEVQTQNDSGADPSQTVTQFSTNEFEILTESEIEQHTTEHVSETASDVSGIQMGRLLSTSGDSMKLESKTLQTSDLPSSKWTECQFCKMVITTVNLWRHIRTQHTPQPPRRCEHCNKNFKNKYSLREHIRISHEQQKPTSITGGGGKVEN